MNNPSAIVIAGTLVAMAGVLQAQDQPGAPEFVEIMHMRELSVAGKPGVEKSYKYLREPNAVVTRNGTLVVVAGPHHVRARNDRAHQDILCRTSKDSGKTWSDITMIADMGMDSVLPTALVYDEVKDRVLFVYNIIFNDPDRPKDQKKPCRQFVMASKDDGATWSKPREILEDIGGICVFGGGNGFQLKRGPHKGRLLIPGGVGKRGYFYSDDHGVTWAFTKLNAAGRREATGCETTDGAIMLNHRGSGYGIYAMFSKDGGDSWTEQESILPDAWSSCNNSALAVTHKGEDLILFGAPVGPKNADKLAVEKEATELVRGVEDSKQSARSNGALFVSRDGGKTWPIAVNVAPGWTFGYNALVQLPDGRIGFVFEGAHSDRGWQAAKRDHNTGTALGIYMVTVGLDWLLGAAAK